MLTNSLTIFEDPFRASLWTLEESLLEDFDLDADFEAEADLEAEAVLDVEEAVLDDLVVLGSDMVVGVVAVSGCGCGGWFVYGDGVDEATSNEDRRRA
jgi:hypothetical protein